MAIIKKFLFESSYWSIISSYRGPVKNVNTNWMNMMQLTPYDKHTSWNFKSI